MMLLLFVDGTTESYLSDALLQGEKSHTRFQAEHIPGVPGRLKRVYGKAQTPLARVLASAQTSAETKQLLKQQKARLNPFALQKLVAKGLKEIAAVRQLRP